MQFVYCFIYDICCLPQVEGSRCNPYILLCNCLLIVWFVTLVFNLCSKKCPSHTAVICRGCGLSCTLQDPNGSPCFSSACVAWVSSPWNPGEETWDSIKVPNTHLKFDEWILKVMGLGEMCRKNPNNPKYGIFTYIYLKKSTIYVGKYTFSWIRCQLSASQQPDDLTVHFHLSLRERCMWGPPDTKYEQWKKNWLFRLYRGLYHLFFWFIISHYRNHY